MSYDRVIPRDLFNEGNLLKMLGKLYILTEGRDNVELELTDGGQQGFRIDQDQGDGSIFAVNVRFTIKGKPYHLYRPLNSRGEWPLWITNGDGDVDFEVFDTDHDDVCLSEEMLVLVGIYDEE